jgi:Asp-tRNA(Asn)/Glu-tRNA(Gln) amidotransferase A subunit family amidase
VLARAVPGERSASNEPAADYRGAVGGAVEGLRVGVPSYFFGPELDDEPRALVEAALSELERIGVAIVRIELPTLALTLPVGYTILLAEAGASHLHWLRERSGEYDPETRRLLEVGALLPWVHVDAAQRARAAICREVERAFRDERLTALAGPTLPKTSFPLDWIVPGEEPYWTKLVPYTFPGNLTGLPAISVPCGFTDAGLPVGLQIFARPFDEATVLRIGHAYQEATSWHERRPALATLPVR